MEFLDNSGHIFTLKSYEYKPIGHEYDENPYIFWIDTNTENFLSVNNYYMRPIYIVLDLSKYNIDSSKQTIFDGNNINVNISLDSQKYTLIGSSTVQEKLNTCESIKDFVDLDNTSKQNLNNNDLISIIIDGNYAIIPFYVLVMSEDEGTWISNILIHISQESYNDFCSISVGSEFRDSYEELMINAQNMGISLPKDIIKAVYNTSYYNNEFNEVIFNEKIKEYMMNYMNIRGEQGNFKSAIDSLNWFGWNNKIEISKLLKTDNEFKSQYFLDYFDISYDVLESYKLFRNTSYISLQVLLNKDTGKYYPKNTEGELEGEENRILEDLMDKYIVDDNISDDNQFKYIKNYYDFSLNELGLKLACLKYYYQKYFLPIHVKIHEGYLVHKVYANDIKFTTFPKIEIAANNVYLGKLSSITHNDNENTFNKYDIEDHSDVKFLGNGIHYFVKLYDFFIDDQFNEFSDYNDSNKDFNNDIYYLNDTCINIPIKFKELNKLYNCVLILEKELDNVDNYKYVYTINDPIKYYERIAYILNNKEVVDYKNIYAAYKEIGENNNYSIYDKSTNILNLLKTDIAEKIIITSTDNNLKRIITDEGEEYFEFNYANKKNIKIDFNEETYISVTIDNVDYTLILPSSDNININPFDNTIMEYMCYKIGDINVKFKSNSDYVTDVIKYSEAGINLVDELQMLPKDIRILNYDERRNYTILHYDEYCYWAEAINKGMSKIDIFNILYDTTKISYEKFINGYITNIDSYKNSKSYIKSYFTEKLTCKLNYNFTKLYQSTLVYESHFNFVQNENHLYENFIICPKLMKDKNIKYWQNHNYRLSLYINGIWYSYEFISKIPEPNINLGTLRYKYWDDDNNYYSNFKQIKYMDNNKVIFNSFMHEPSLVINNNVNYYSELLKENLKNNIFNYNDNNINIFKTCDNYIVYNDNIYRINKEIINNHYKLYIPKNLPEGITEFQSIIIYEYQYINDKLNIVYFIRQNEFDSYKIYIDETQDYVEFDYEYDNKYINNDITYYIYEIIHSSTSLIDKYKFNISINNDKKYLNSIYLFDLYKKVNRQDNILIFHNNTNLSINGILFIHDNYNDVFHLSGKQLRNMGNTYSGRIVDKDNNVLANDGIDIYGYRYNDPFNIAPLKTNKYIYYIYKDEDNDHNIVTKITSSPSTSKSEKLIFYTNVYENTEEFLNYLENNIYISVENQIKNNGYALLKENDVYYITYDNINKYEIFYTIKFKEYDNGNLVNAKVNQEELYTYYNNKIYKKTDAEHKNQILLEISLYYTKQILFNNVQIVIDNIYNNLEYTVIKYVHNGDEIRLKPDDLIILDNDRIKYNGIIFNVIPDATSDIKNCKNYKCYDYGHDLIKFYNRIDSRNLSFIKLWDEDFTYGIKLNTLSEIDYLDDNGNIIGRDNPVNYWYFDDDIDTIFENDNYRTGNINITLDKDNYENQFNELKELLENYYLGETGNERKAYDNKNGVTTYWPEMDPKKFDETSLDLLDDIKKPNIFIQRNIVNIIPGKYTLKWYDSYTGHKDINDANSKYESIHKSIKLFAVVCDADGNFAKDDEGNILMYYENDADIEIKDGQIIKVVFMISYCEDTYDGFWIKPELLRNSTDYVPVKYTPYIPENEVSLELNGNEYLYGSVKDPEIIKLYNTLFKTIYIVTDNETGKLNVLDNTIKEDIDIINNPDSYTVNKIIYKQIDSLNLNKELDYDLYLMHDNKQWYCIYISEQTLDQVTNVNSIYNVKHNNIDIENTPYILKFNRHENKFLLNRYICDFKDNINVFNDNDIIIAQLVNNDRLPINMDINAKYEIHSISIGNNINKYVKSNSEMTIINVPEDDNKYKKGYYSINVNYSLDGFTQQSYQDTIKFKVIQS